MLSSVDPALDRALQHTAREPAFDGVFVCTEVTGVAASSPCQIGSFLPASPAEAALVCCGSTNSSTATAAAFAALAWPALHLHLLRRSLPRAITASRLRTGAGAGVVRQVTSGLAES